VITARLANSGPGGIAIVTFLSALRPFERLKNPQQPSRVIVDENMQPAEQFTALDSWITQNVLTLELEEINSLLCGPCGCTLCCTGPSAEQGSFSKSHWLRARLPFLTCPDLMMKKPGPHPLMTPRPLSCTAHLFTQTLLLFTPGARAGA